MNSRLKIDKSKLWLLNDILLDSIQSTAIVIRVENQWTNMFSIRMLYEHVAVKIKDVWHDLGLLRDLGFTRLYPPRCLAPSPKSLKIGSYIRVLRTSFCKMITHPRKPSYKI